MKGSSSGDSSGCGGMIVVLSNAGSVFMYASSVAIVHSTYLC